MSFPSIILAISTEKKKSTLIYKKQQTTYNTNNKYINEVMNSIGCSKIDYTFSAFCKETGT